MRQWKAREFEKFPQSHPLAEWGPEMNHTPKNLLGLGGNAWEESIWEELCEIQHVGCLQVHCWLDSGWTPMNPIPQLASELLNEIRPCVGLYGWRGPSPSLNPGTSVTVPGSSVLLCLESPNVRMGLCEFIDQMRLLMMLIHEAFCFLYSSAEPPSHCPWNSCSQVSSVCCEGSDVFAVRVPISELMIMSPQQGQPDVLLTSGLTLLWCSESLKQNAILTTPS